MLSCIVVWTATTVWAQPSPWRCADMSFLDQMEDAGAVYTDAGVAGDALAILQSKGLNGVRLRLFHSPSGIRDGLQDVAPLAQRAQAAGLPWILDFHYSDTWADPGHQTKPAAWDTLGFESLVDSVGAYTERVLTTLDGQGLRPAVVQLGNEITTGMLWDDGRVGGSFDVPTQWQKLADLLNSGADAVRTVLGTNAKIMIHIDRGGDKAGARWFFDSLSPHSVDFDLIGLSFYPWWHGTLEDLTETIDAVVEAYNKPVLIAEIGYPWTLGWFDDTHNFVGLPTHLHPGYPASPEGQRNYIRDLMDIAIDSTDVIGACYWEPAYISAPGMGSSWENIALFDNTGEALPAASALGGTGDTHAPTPETSGPGPALVIYPNPARHWARVLTWNDVPGCSEVRILDILGRLQATQPACGSGQIAVTVPVDGWPPGVYVAVAKGHAAPFVVAR